MNNQSQSIYRTNPRTYAHALSCLVAGLHAVSEASNPLNRLSSDGLTQTSPELIELCIEDSFAKEIAALPPHLAQAFREDIEFKLTRDALILLNPNSPDFSFLLEGLSRRLQNMGFCLFIKKPDGARLEWFPEIEVLPHQRLVVERR